MKLDLEDIEIVSEDIEGWLVATEDNITVALDTQIDEQLKMEGIAREIVNRIQNLRKQNGFEVTDRISIVYNSTDEIKTAVANMSDYIKNETLAEKVDFSDKKEGEDIQIDEDTINIKITRL